MRSRVWAWAVAALAGGPAGAQPFVDDFENGVNAGHWVLIGGPGGSIQPAGGNPGAYFGGTSFNYPVFRATGESPFTGNYRDDFVLVLGADFITRAHQGAIFPLTLLLATDNGTPKGPSDDWGAYFTSNQFVPSTGAGWERYWFMVDSQSAVLPPGWVWHDGGNPPPTHDWPRLMRSVSRVEFLFAPPGTISNFPVWTVGLDNATITRNPPDCYVNCDGSSTAPLLTVNDFICYMAAFASGSVYADCDANQSLNVNDFVCFQNQAALGCR